jgi:hypothetical protein
MTGITTKYLVHSILERQIRSFWSETVNEIILSPNFVITKLFGT